jgi:glutathione synthase/RimK-type ligase-like ATP-grasp enzyme
MIERLAWVSAREAWGRDEDEGLVLPAVRAAGVDVEVVVWDDPAVRWAAYDRVVLRSTWDYPQRLDRFLAWLDEVAAVTDLRNPVPMVRWSLDKHYLAELDAAGVAVTPTVYVEPGERPSFPDGEFIVKPAIGAGSRDVASYGPDDHEAARAHVRRLNASVLVQPMLKSVATDGEWPLVFFGGRYSHAASKRVALPAVGVVDDLFAEETNVPYVASPAQIEVAERAVALVTERFGVPLYARVDLVRDDDGRPCVLELELVEPSLFLPQAPPEATERFVTALVE